MPYLTDLTLRIRACQRLLNLIGIGNFFPMCGRLCSSVWVLSSFTLQHTIPKQTTQASAQTSPSRLPHDSYQHLRATSTVAGILAALQRSFNNSSSTGNPTPKEIAYGFTPVQALDFAKPSADLTVEAETPYHRFPDLPRSLSQTRLLP